MALGDLILASKIYDESRGIITSSCLGKLTANVFFGKAGVGKSTIASLSATVPGLFDVGTVMLLNNYPCRNSLLDCNLRELFTFKVFEADKSL